MPFYQEALSEFEGEPLALAFTEVMMGWKYARAPTPADLREACHGKSGGKNPWSIFTKLELVDKIVFWRKKRGDDINGFGAYGLQQLENEYTRRGGDLTKIPVPIERTEPTKEGTFIYPASWHWDGSLGQIQRLGDLYMQISIDEKIPWDRLLTIPEDRLQGLVDAAALGEVSREKRAREPGDSFNSPIDELNAIAENLPGDPFGDDLGAGR